MTARCPPCWLHEGLHHSHEGAVQPENARCVMQDGVETLFSVQLAEQENDVTIASACYFYIGSQS